jgi:hypothetical protein
VGALSTAVPKPDDRRFDTLSHFDNFSDFFSVHFTHASSVNTEILGEAVHATTIDGPMTRYDTIAKGVMEEHAIVGGAVGDK